MTYAARSQRNRRNWASPLMTNVVTAIGGTPCRVCGAEVAAGDLARFRAWGIELSHKACGWFRADEGAPVERRKSGSFATYWEWRCPECKLDAASLQRPAAGMDMRCGRCKLVRVGDNAVTVRTLTAGRFSIPPGRKCVVQEISEDGATARVCVGVTTLVLPIGALARARAEAK